MNPEQFAAALRAAYAQDQFYSGVEFTQAQYAQVVAEMSQDPRFQVSRTSNGQLQALDNIQNLALGSSLLFFNNSNVLDSRYGVGNATANVPLNLVEDAGAGTASWEAGTRSLATGSKLLTIADGAALGLAGVSIGAKLGKTIDETFNI